MYNKNNVMIKTKILIQIIEQKKKQLKMILIIVTYIDKKKIV